MSNTYREMMERIKAFNKTLDRPASEIAEGIQKQVEHAIALGVDVREDMTYGELLIAIKEKERIL